ncbi:ATP-dependent exoDNAse (exonuclease V) beta subunit (contains helicase and exonuclease domains) [Bryocella elongata]|uniref:DNA 3'-5' helicase n=1 Tax=Bryocella elongata TaxID=863522 RepID=A0A1H5WYQ9_9BACT|nr:UvrD-helicase domain-containing protein [Bryocella elongata]SEG04230.1 ATP-dependent exoDNAse (exonuclease V) beta subunit (contains helicase and exonuclease domains) [Bryocella elongata]
MPDLFDLQPLPLADAEARRLALDTHRSAIVEAPAGSGKTGLLMQRFLKLLTDEAVTEPEEILAVTFTNKAAAEMRERVLEQLHFARNAQLHAARDAKPLTDDAFQQQTRLFAEQVLARDAILGWNLLDRPQRLNLRTIDSLSAEIANSLPLVSGAGAPRTPATDPQPLYHAAAHRTLQQLGGTDSALNDALRLVLLHRDANLRDCERLLADMLAKREQWGELVPLTPGELDDAELDRTVRPKLERLLETIVCDGLAHAARLLPSGVLHELTQIAAALGDAPGTAGASPFAHCANKNEPPEAIASHLDHWVALISLVLKPSDNDWRARFQKNDLKVEIDKLSQQRLKDLVPGIATDALREALAAVRELPPARYPDEQWAVARALFHVLRHALAELRLLFAERGQCDFSELALNARQALRTDLAAPDLALAYGGRLRHLLVDEMQDTSAGQYELITLLTRSFDGHSQTLFLVGDPKQSIYLFRQARVERFLHTLEAGRLGEIDLDVLRLTSNFRSQAQLVDDFNTAFQPLFASLDEGTTPPSGEIAFVSATPVRKPSDFAEAMVWHPTVLPAPARSGPGDADASTEDDIPDTRAQQALELRSVIEKWRLQPLPEGRTKPWSIAVLGSSRTQLQPVIAEFKLDRGHGTIPYRAVEIDPLGLRPEVLDVLALTRALLHPADRVAWLAVLRAPWCGLTMADLLALTGEGVDPNSHALAEATIPWLVAHRAELLSIEGQHLLQRAWPVLATAASTLGATPLAIHIERTWRSLGGNLPLDAAARDNVRRFFALLSELTADNPSIDLSLLETRLAKLYAEPAPADNAVELMTMHKAKGLEWDVVLVPSLDRKPGGDREPLLNWIELEQDGADSSSVLLAPISGAGEDNSRLNDWLKAARARREAAERRRVFYVACTRAREELHLFGAVRRKQDGAIGKPTHGSLLQACWPFAHTVFEEQAQRPVPSLEPAQEFEVTARDPWEHEQEHGLALAASASETQAPLILERLPASLDFNAPFQQAEEHRLPYASAAALPSAPAFDRPEGSFAVRAYGNVVHRYLQRIAEQLDAGSDLDAMAQDIASWEPRLLASLRGEGLTLAQAQREAARARAVLASALGDPIGRWILSPHTQSSSEHELMLAGEHAAVRNLRADRIFVTSTPPPGLEAAFETSNPATWIIDFKTAEQGSRTDALFEQQQRARYSTQLEFYAASLTALNTTPQPILLALYYPEAKKLFWWHASNPSASKTA